MIKPRDLTQVFGKFQHKPFDLGHWAAYNTQTS